MACFVEVGRVCSFPALEVFLAERLVAHLYDAALVIVPQYGYAILLAHLFYYLTYIRKAGSVNIPWRNKSYPGLGTQGLDALNHCYKGISKHLQGILVYLRIINGTSHHAGVIVSCNDNDIISIRVHRLIALPHGGPEIPLAVMRPVEGYTGPILAIVVIDESLFLCQFIMPRLSIGIAMIRNIRITDDIKNLLPVGRNICCTQQDTAYDNTSSQLLSFKFLILNS